MVKRREAPVDGPIRRADRITRVLERDERMLELLVELSPAFRRLRNPTMRKVMSRLATVEHAARIAGLDPDWLVQRLNQSIDEIVDSKEDGTMTRRNEMGQEPPPSRTGTAAPPQAVSEIPAEQIVDLDVREALRRGEEPFRQIMAAKSALGEQDVLRLRAIFEPVPLYAVMAKQGYAHWTEQLADDDWRVWFYPQEDEGGEDDEPASPPTTDEANGRGDAVPADDPNVIILDVRGLEPPEPMVRTLAALETLPPDGTLIQLNVRVPQFLLPQLEARGFTYEIRPQDGALTRVIIRRAQGTAS